MSCLSCFQYFIIHIMSISIYPVQHFSPAFRCNTLKHCKHGKAKVVKVSDSKVRTRPTCLTFGAIDGAATPVSGLSAWWWFLVLSDSDNVWNRGIISIDVQYINVKMYKVFWICLLDEVSIYIELTSALIVTRLVHFTLEQLQAHNGINGDHEEDQQCDVEERQHGFQNRAHHHLQAWRKKDELQNQIYHLIYSSIWLVKWWFLYDEVINL